MLHPIFKLNNSFFSIEKPWFYPGIEYSISSKTPNRSNLFLCRNTVCTRTLLSCTHIDKMLTLKFMWNYTAKKFNSGANQGDSLVCDSFGLDQTLCKIQLPQRMHICIHKLCKSDLLRTVCNNANEVEIFNKIYSFIN